MNKASTKLPEKKAYDWSKLKFGYNPADFRFQAHWKNGQWGTSEVVKDAYIHIHEGSTAVHYSQQCFEGMKAFSTRDGRVLLFRPELNWERMTATAERLVMPPVPKDLFMRGVMEAVAYNYAFIPPYGSGASLYIRPFLIGIGENLGVKTAPEFLFRVFVSPVGPYYNSGKINPITLLISSQDRAAPRGIGHIKAGANYVPGLLHQHKAKEKGANEVMFLDPLQHKYIEEAGTTNVLLVTKDKKLITPKAETILPSITRRSLMFLGKEALGLRTEERPIDFYAEADTFAEFAICGTAAVLTPVGKVVDEDGKSFVFHDQGQSIGPVMSELYTRLTDLQNGSAPDTYSWTLEVPIQNSSPRI